MSFRDKLCRKINFDNSNKLLCLFFSSDIPWPEGDEAISEACKEAIDSLLTIDPNQRPGARGESNT